MITKDLEENKMCLFCASDYHLEMILLPYIKEKIDNSKFIILTENNLKDTLNALLERVNIDEKDKNKIRNLDWNEKDNLYIENIKIKNNENINIIVNGEYDYINTTNNKLKNIINENVNIIDCFHVGDINVDIDLISRNYKYILNTKRM